MRKSSKKRRRAKGKKATKFLWKRWLLLSVAALLLGVTLYMLYLDHIVQIRFDGRRWTMPAQVYARPLLLSAGRQVKPARLLIELDGLGYRRVKHPDQAGSYSNYKGRFLLRTRGLKLPGRDIPSVYLEILFKGDRVVSIKQAASGTGLEKFTLEPRLIGSLHPAHSEDRLLLRRSELQEGLVKALIAVEDRNFYQHFGVDPGAILRALWANLRAERVVQGGSTLTQQLVKNFFLIPERSLWRKLNEVLMALILEIRYSKDEILEAYANEIYLGQDGGRAIHGFGLASHFYFNRPLEELDLPKMALLITLVRGPSAYDPRRHPERARQRRTLVLQIMQEQGLISAELAKQAAAAPLGIQQGVTRSSGTPAFMDLVRRQLRRDYQESDLIGEGLHIFTTLDPWLQSQAEQALSSQLGELEATQRKAKRSLQGAIVVADVQSGEVVALVGDKNPRYAGFNRALDAVRPVGSLIKPVVYLTALSKPEKYHLLSKLDDIPIHITGVNGQVWSPRNYDRVSHGSVYLQNALANSYNQATVRLGMSIGLQNVLHQLSSAGIKRPISPYPSVLLGAVAISPLEMTQMYQTLAAGGSLAVLKAIREVSDNQGHILSRYPVTVKQTLDPSAVYLLNHALQEAVRSGTAKALSGLLPQGVRVAGKTGTTDDLRDSWFAGYDQRHVAVVWLGSDDNQPTGLTGSKGAMRVWGTLMRQAGVASLTPSLPAGVEVLEIEPDSGLRGAGCPDAISVPFIKGSGPWQEAACARRSKRVFDNEINWLQKLFD